MILLLLALAFQTPQDEATYDRDLKAAVRASTNCLKSEVDRRVPAEVTQLTEEKRSEIRVAVALACYEHTERLAEFTSDVRSGAKTAKEVARSMVVEDVKLAEGFIRVRLDNNAKAAVAKD
jgi:hypothetical protein